MEACSLSRRCYLQKSPRLLAISYLACASLVWTGPTDIIDPYHQVLTTSIPRLLGKKPHYTALLLERLLCMFNIPAFSSAYL